MEDAPDRAERRAEEREPVTEAGGGEAEGFEQAEEELVDAAEHGSTEGGGRHPLGDRMPAEADERPAHTIHGEADQPESTEEADREQPTETDDD